MSLGRIQLLTPTEARNVAKQQLANIVANGSDPVSTKTNYKNDITISELCNLYLQEGTLNKKESTIKNDKSRIERQLSHSLEIYTSKNFQKSTSVKW